MGALGNIRYILQYVFSGFARDEEGRGCFTEFTIYSPGSVFQWAMRFSCDTLCFSSLFCRTIWHPVASHPGFLRFYLFLAKCITLHSLEQLAVLPRPSVGSCNIILTLVFSSNISGAISVSRKVEFPQSS